MTRDTELDKEVDLTATIVKGYAQKTKSFHVTVPAMGKIQMLSLIHIFHDSDYAGISVYSEVLCNRRYGGFIKGLILLI